MSSRASYRSWSRITAPLLLGAAAACALAACGGSGGVSPPQDDGSSPTPAAPTTLSGKVAVGAPMTGGTLRVLNADGVEIANQSISDAGAYAPITLSGPAPYRIEACGYMGVNYACLYSIATAPGVANVTPLTNAMLLLASGKSPEDVMDDALPAGTTEHLADAQALLQLKLKDLMTDAQITGAFDFISGDLQPGERTGYDRLLDAVGVSTGEDEKPFVQFTPRFGAGNLYIEAGGDAVGAITPDTNSGAVDLSGIEQLFKAMSAAVASEAACSNPDTGLATLMTQSVRMDFDGGEPLSGPADVGAALCEMFGGGGDMGMPMWGAQFVSPRLGRCTLTNDQVCRITFGLKDVEGGVREVGEGMGVQQIDGQWKFRGLVDPIPVHANATAQRDRRIDEQGATVYESYLRALQFDIPALTGLQCVRISQRKPDQSLTTVAYYKPYGPGVPRLSLWLSNDPGAFRSLDPTSAGGHLRSADDTWVMLPAEAEGDEVVRNFFKGGRTVLMDFFADAECTTAFHIDNGPASMEVEIQGVPPVASALVSQPWVEFTAPTLAGLVSLQIGDGQTSLVSAAWSANPVGFDEITFCGMRSCGEGDGGRIGQVNFSPKRTSVQFEVTPHGYSVAPDGFKMLSIYGRNSDGMALQTNTMYCPQAPSPGPCI